MQTAIPSTSLSFQVLELAASVLRILGHPQRLRMIELLSAGPMTVSQLTQELGLAQNAVSQHLNLMKTRGILSSRRYGRTVRYQIVHPQARTVLGCIRRNASD
jgi:ArsR family transcriptional regulator